MLDRVTTRLFKTQYMTVDGEVASYYLIPITRYNVRKHMIPTQVQDASSLKNW